MDDDDNSDPIEWGCHCERDADDLLTHACDNHRMPHAIEYRVRQVMDEEIDANLADMFGRRPIERKEGAVFGNFAIARKR